ncbi:MAG TPA: hypothetical protein VF755_08205 [Catenuloplanes sp.]
MTASSVETDPQQPDGDRAGQQPDADGQQPAGDRSGNFARRALPHLVAMVGYLALALYLTAGLWSDPKRRVPAFLDGADEILLQWYLAHAAHVVAHLENPFFTTAMNAPAGVNIAGNASVLGLGIPLAPLTWLAGAEVTTLVVITGSLFLTALAWYWLFCRKLRLHPGAALLGGLFCGFAPPLMFEASGGHQHITSQFVIPFIVWRFTQIAVGGRPVRDGALLGLLVAYQATIGEEVLLFTAIALAVFGVAYGVRRPRRALAMVPALARGLAVTTLVAGGLLAVLLAYQFAGPQHYSGNPQDPQPFRSDVADYAGIPAPGPFWSAEAVGRLGVAAPVVGLPLALVILVFGWQLRRNVLFTSALAVATMMALFSLGIEITLFDKPLGVPGPWRWVARLPVFEWAIPMRIGHLAVPGVGLVIALILHRAVQRWREGARPVAAAAIAATVLALLTLTPTPFETITRPPVPRFVTAGTWRAYMPPGRTLVTVPAPSLPSFDGMRWAVASGGDIVIPGGYFLGPSPEDNGRTTLFGTSYAWATRMWIDVLQSGKVWQARPGDRERLLADLRFWKASVVVLVPTAANADALRASVEQFLGPPQRVDDVWLWDVRALV